MHFVLSKAIKCRSGLLMGDGHTNSPWASLELVLAHPPALLPRPKSMLKFAYFEFPAVQKTQKASIISLPRSLAATDSVAAEPTTVVP